MIRKRKVIIISIALIIIFFISTNLLFSLLTTEIEVRSIHDHIYFHLNNLPSIYKHKEISNNDSFNIFLKYINSPIHETDVTKIWQIANSWVSKNRLVDHENSFIGSVLLAMQNTKIIKADLDTRGTQLKLLLTLEGGQNVIFKPRWYEIDRVIQGPVYAGKDRYFSEIFAFYLSVILNMPFTPCSVERTISFTHDILPVATSRLMNTSFKIHNRTCIYGKCFYCKKEDPICENENLKIQGAAIFNIDALFKNYKSPWQRTYKKSKKALWEVEDAYCNSVKEKLKRRRILDLVDVAIFDFLIQNGDRHHYETFYDNVVLIDNGKGFGNPNISHLDILAPLYQCCMLKSTTFKKLLNLTGGRLREKIEAIPNIKKLLTSDHLDAIEKRLLIIFATIEYCNNKNKK